ncbi:MAG: DUF2939 domain-containing protein [Candidatus Acinetobacter avistercoris]|nr:DUF2939 domain-containing protein [Candidatus Acinetobacter avistercoris]
MNKSSNSVVFGVVVGVLAAVAVSFIYLYMSPYIALKKIESAYLDRDAVGVSKYIDYSSLRMSIKKQLEESVKKNSPDGKVMHKGKELDLNSVAAQAFLGAGLNKMISHEVLEIALETMSDKALHQYKKAGTQSPHGYTMTYTMGYKSTNEFGVKFTMMSSKMPFEIVLKRDGLSWKVSALEITEMLAMAKQEKEKKASELASKLLDQKPGSN